LQYVFLSHDIDWRRQGPPKQHIMDRKDRFEPEVIEKLSTENPYYNIPKIMNIEENAIESIDKKPHGSYAVDLKGDSQDNWCVTEIDSGKFHTTTPLWGYISTKIFKQEPEKNLPYLYVMLGLGKIADTVELGYDIYPENTTLLRHIDCGDWILDNKGTRIQVL